MVLGKLKEKIKKTKAEREKIKRVKKMLAEAEDTYQARRIVETVRKAGGYISEQEAKEYVKWLKKQKVAERRKEAIKKTATSFLLSTGFPKEHLHHKKKKEPIVIDPFEDYPVLRSLSSNKSREKSIKSKTKKSSKKRRRSKKKGKRSKNSGRKTQAIEIRLI